MTNPREHGLGLLDRSAGNGVAPCWPSRPAPSRPRSGRGVPGEARFSPPGYRSARTERGVGD